MKKLLILLLGCTLSSFAQNNCNCSDVLDQVITKVEKEYPGFKDKQKDTLIYNNFKRSLISNAVSFNDDSCSSILKQYIKYFKDGHLSLNQKNVKESKALNPGKIFDIDINSFQKSLRNNKDSIEGIWKYSGYRIGLKKINKDYIAFIISSENKSWKEKEIKFKLLGSGRAEFFKGDHSKNQETYSVTKDCIIYFKNMEVAFVKEIPNPQIPADSITKYLNEIEGFYIKPISKKTLLLKLASFDYSYTERINKLIAENKDLLNNYPNWIIDVRGNGGGTDYSYHPFLPYIYTNPVRFLSGEYLVTPTLVNGLENWANSADTSKFADDILSVKQTIKRMKGKTGEFIPYAESDNYGFTKYDSIYSNPKYVVFLVDGRCGSSTEKFLLSAKQSKKVKIMGSPTYGAVDYVSVREFQIACSNYSLYMPTVRMMRLPDYPIDNIGIQPDIYMDKYIGDWVKYAIDYLEN